MMAGCSAPVAPLQQRVENVAPPLIVPTGRMHMRFSGEPTIAFVALDGTISSRGLLDGGALAEQTLTGGSGGEYVTWYVEMRPGRNLRGFEDDHARWTRSTAVMTVCGQIVQLQTARLPAIATIGNRPAHDPPKVAFAIAVPHRGQTIVARFEAASDHLELWEPIAHELLGSLRCL
jgi:hypothetical protein